MNKYISDSELLQLEKQLKKLQDAKELKLKKRQIKKQIRELENETKITHRFFKKSKKAINKVSTSIKDRID